MSWFDKIVFIFVSALIAYNVEEWIKTKKPTKFSLVVFQSLIFVGLCIDLILKNT